MTSQFRLSVGLFIVFAGILFGWFSKPNPIKDILDQDTDWFAPEPIGPKNLAPAVLRITNTGIFAEFDGNLNVSNVDESVDEQTMDDALQPEDDVLDIEKHLVAIIRENDDWRVQLSGVPDYQTYVLRAGELTQDGWKILDIKSTHIDIARNGEQKRLYAFQTIGDGN